MTTVDPDTLERDSEVLRDIGRRFRGRLALNADVARPGAIAIGDPVRLAPRLLVRRQVTPLGSAWSCRAELRMNIRVESDSLAWMLASVRQSESVRSSQNAQRVIGPEVGDSWSREVSA